MQTGRPAEGLSETLGTEHQALASSLLPSAVPAVCSCWPGESLHFGEAENRHAEAKERVSGPDAWALTLAPLRGSADHAMQLRQASAHAQHRGGWG